MKKIFLFNGLISDLADYYQSNIFVIWWREAYLCGIICDAKYKPETYNLFMKTNFIGLVFILFSVHIVNAQTVADSIAIVTAPWEVVTVENGVVYKRASISSLYQGTQSIHILEINPETGKKVGIALTGQLEKISRIAPKHQAIGAINGSYFDMAKGNSVCFLKVGRQVIDTTSLGELKLRVTGAVYEKRGKVKLIPWDRQIEKNYKKNKGSVLASGPLMLKNGKYYDWSKCNANFIATKHPRSAICLTEEGKVLFVTVDGRSPENAVGINIPELAHLLHVLGARDALNLDGGGSTALWLTGAPEEGIVNFPCDNRSYDHKGERKVANFLYVHD